MDDKKRALGDLETTHMDELMPETTLEEKTSEAGIESLRLQVEELEKRVASLDMDLQHCKQKEALSKKTAAELHSSLEEARTIIESKDAKLVVMRDSINGLENKVNTLNNEITGKENKIVSLSSDIDQIENTAASNLVIISNLQKHYYTKPVIPHGWRASIADWLMDGFIEETREWFIKLYDKLKITTG